MCSYDQSISTKLNRKGALAMLSKLKKIKSKSEGFTIIEVMIVLAIAGLILLIVFLAVPALQRSARNTQRKTDASAIASAVSNYIGDNNGTLPDAEGYVTATPTDVGIYCTGSVPAVLTAGNAGVNTSCTASTTNYEQAKLGFYNPKNSVIFFSNSAATLAVGAPTSVPSAANITDNSIVIDLEYDCTKTSNSRAAAVYYVTENGSGNGNLNCIDT